MSQDSQENQSYPLRLPNYRFLHQGRYHPYPTFNRHQGTFVDEINDIEIIDALTGPADGAEPYAPTQPGPSMLPQSQPVDNERFDADFANLAVVVDEMRGGTASGISACRNSVDLILAFASAMRCRALASGTNIRS